MPSLSSTLPCLRAGLSGLEGLGLSGLEGLGLSGLEGLGFSGLEGLGFSGLEGLGLSGLTWRVEGVTDSFTYSPLLG